MAKQSTRCKTCGRLIRVRAKGMKIGSAVRKHYWRHHPDVMMRNRAEREWDTQPAKAKRARPS